MDKGTRMVLALGSPVKLSSEAAESILREMEALEARVEALKERNADQARIIECRDQTNEDLGQHIEVLYRERDMVRTQNEHLIKSLTERALSEPISVEPPGAGKTASEMREMQDEADRKVRQAMHCSLVGKSTRQKIAAEAERMGVTATESLVRDALDAARLMDDAMAGNNPGWLKMVDLDQIALDCATHIAEVPHAHHFLGGEPQRKARVQNIVHDGIREALMKVADAAEAGSEFADLDIRQEDGVDMLVGMIRRKCGKKIPW